MKLPHEFTKSQKRIYLRPDSVDWRWSPDYVESLEARVEELERAVKFGQIMLEATKEAIREGAFEMDAEQAANDAVNVGLIQYVPYDPEKHGEVEAEVGDNIYYWGD